MAFAATNEVQVEQIGDHITTQDLNIRSQAKLGNNLIDHIKKGHSMKVKKMVGQWCEIEFKKYRHTYVACRFLKAVNESPQQISESNTLSNHNQFQLLPIRINYKGIKMETKSILLTEIFMKN